MPDYLSDEVCIIVADDVPGEPGGMVGMAMQLDGTQTMMPAVTSDTTALAKMIEVMVQQDVAAHLTGRSGNGS